MKNKSVRMSLLQEERISNVFFLWLFYIVFLIYGIFYYLLLPVFPWVSDFTIDVRYDINLIKTIVIVAILPVMIYYIKTNRAWYSKYILFLTYTLVTFFTDIWYYWGNDIAYRSGDLVELIFILFSPIFTNKRYFYLVSLGSMLRYAITGLVIQDLVVGFPVFFCFVLSIVAYVLLHRFLSFVEAIKTSYDSQLEGLVKGVIATLELKDPYTRGHSERVAEYAMSLAKATGKFKDSELDHFYYACLLHDIGKVNIPDAILTKPGRLTDEEYEVVKTHPVVGAKAIEDVEGIAEDIDVIYHHHERWDGKGYPEGLKGEETPLLARIAAIADAFDAMTSSRSYRAALSFEEAYQRILDAKGTQFDPNLVEIFQQVYPSWIEIHRKYKSKSNVLERGGILNENPQT